MGLNASRCSYGREMRVVLTNICDAGPSPFRLSLVAMLPLCVAGASPAVSIGDVVPPVPSLPACAYRSSSRV
nr:hypothetical protein Q903MT_gene1414 [Picea sitchensis]